MAALASGEPLANTRWTGLNLRGIDLTRRNLEGVVFEDCDMGGAILEYASLPEAVFAGSIFRRTRFANANLRNVIVRNGEFDGADFSQADLRGLMAASA